MRGAADAAREAGHVTIASYQMDSCLSRYDLTVGEGLDVNPEPASRKRDSLERESYSLASVFCKLGREVALFAEDLWVRFNNNQSERDLKMEKLEQKISGSLRSTHGTDRLAIVRSYISTAFKHQLDTLDVPTELFPGHLYMPPVPLRT